MSKKPNYNQDLRGAGKLTADAIKGITDVAEALHRSILTLGGTIGSNSKGKTKGIAGLVYNNIRSTSDLAGRGFDAVAAMLAPAVEEKESSPGREALLSAINGVLGDYLEENRSQLAIPMHFRREGKTIKFDDPEFTHLVKQSSGKVAILIHGSCMNDLQWNREGHDHGNALARDLGYFPIYLHYNSGRHISQNGRELSGLIQGLVSKTDSISELVILAHSMGGLVARSACFYANESNQEWPDKLKKIVFLGTPHHGAPLERIGNRLQNILELNAFSKPLSRLGKLRSAGVTDLRYGNVTDADWKGRDRFEAAGDVRVPVLLPENIECFAMAAVSGTLSGKLAEEIIGDGLVPLNSALGKHNNPDFDLAFPESRQWVGQNMTHLDLLNHPEVYETIKKFISA